jgi:hypothetical protein
MRERRRLILALAGSGALAACGGGAPDAPSVQSEETLSQPLGVGAGGTGMRWGSLITGPVARVRPLGVAGVTLITAKAQLTDGDGHLLTESDLELGMTSRVLAGPIRATNGSSVAQAQTLVVDTQLRGAAQRLDARTLRLLEQRVTLSGSTVYGPGVDLMAPNLALRVWGQLDLAGGRITATRVALMVPGDSTMLRGLLGALDPLSGRLQIGTLVARPADPSAVPTIVSTGLRPGAVVRAVLGPRGADGVWELLALRDDALRPPDNVTAQLEGRVTQFDSSRSFALDGVAVDATTATVEGARYLALGAAVEVSGTMRRGVLVAREVHAEAPEPAEHEGRGAAVKGGTDQP